MGFNSILGKGIISPTSIGKNSFEDLNINQIISEINLQAFGGDVSEFFQVLPQEWEDSKYRREVYRDIHEKGVYELLEHFSEGMRSAREMCANEEEVHHIIQQQFWHLNAVFDYCKSVYELEEGIDKRGCPSEGMCELSQFLKELIRGDEFASMWEEVRKLKTELVNLHPVLTIENDFVSVSLAETNHTYEEFLASSFENKKSNLESPFLASLQLSELEMSIVDALYKKKKDFFVRVRSFYNHYKEYENETVMRFFREVQFYLSYYRFENKMKKAGMLFCFPETNEEVRLYARGLYDLALACVNIKFSREVVPNDMEYEEKEAFLIVNGPNQGGKTTFARSLGQLIYFTKLGLTVPASSANVPFFQSIRTHFSVEESVETGRGKLKEELDRLAPMLRQQSGKSFVIINELFTTAANYDACIMGKKVLQHFISKDCRGVYVTHLKELSEADPAVVSMTAMLDSKDYHKRTYKIIRKVPEEIGYAGDIVEKYELTYEQLKKRLPKEGGYR